MKIRRKEDIKGNLYTRGGLFQVYDAGNKVQKINTYVGPYHLKNNVAYEGAEPRRGAKKLRKIVRNQNIFTYNKLNSDYAKRFTGVVSSVPSIIEVNKNTYKEVKKQKTPHHKLYSILEIEWKISGPIFNKLFKGNIIESGIIPTNNKSLELSEDTMPGISQYIGDSLHHTSMPHKYLEPLSETIFDPEQKTEEEKIMQTPTKTYNSLQ